MGYSKATMKLFFTYNTEQEKIQSGHKKRITLLHGEADAQENFIILLNKVIKVDAGKINKWLVNWTVAKDKGAFNEINLFSLKHN